MTFQPPSIVARVADRAPAPAAAGRKWLQLALGIGLVLLFIFGLGSLAQLIPGAAHMAQVIEERGLRATAIYYTDFEEPAEGSAYIRDSLDFRPEGR